MWQPFFPSLYDFKYADHNSRIKNFYSNFDVDKNSNSILIIFDGGSGGGFLANCLSFSNKVGSTIDNKLNFLLEKLERMDVIWEDFHLNNDIIHGKYFFILDHPFTPKVLKYHLEKWNSSNVILFKNTAAFCKLRRCVWNVNGEICYDENYIQGIIENKSELKKYNDKNQSYSFCNLTKKINFYIWDVNWYFSFEQTILNLKILYELLELGTIDEKSIKKYYDMWIKKINYLKDISVRYE
jgi:hypothetical protein